MYRGIQTFRKMRQARLADMAQHKDYSNTRNGGQAIFAEDAGREKKSAAIITLERKPALLNKSLKS